MSRTTNQIGVPNALVAAPAFGATQDLDWSLYGSAYLTPVVDAMSITLTLTCSNKIAGQPFDLFINCDAGAMSISITFPTSKLNSGFTGITTAGIHHLRMHWINGVMYITRLSADYS